MQFEFIEMNDVQKQTRVLHVMYGVNCGGVEATVYNYYRKMNRSKFHFDVVSQKDRNQDVSTDLFAQKFRDLGSNVYYIPSKQDNFCSCMYGFAKILRKTSYDIVHIHMGQGSLPYVVCAKLLGITHIVVHTHIAFDKTGWTVRPTTRIMRWLLKYFNVHKAACSQEAATEAWPNQNVFVLNNAVDGVAYLQDVQKRQAIRKELNIEKDITLCAVARFTESKNHSFLIDIFEEFLTANANAKLVLIGNGELEQTIRQKVNMRNLEQKVLFLGARSDIPELLQAMDVFVLPSQFEGFGIVYIEAQLAGLPTFAIEGAVPNAVNVSDSLKLMPKHATPIQWAEQIRTVLNQPKHSENILSNIKQHGFDINCEAKKLEAFYLDILQN